MPSRKYTSACAAALGIALVAIATSHWLLQRHTGSILLRTEPDAILSDDQLLRQAAGIGRPLFAHRCAVCHGADRRGNRQHGTPDMADGAWLYGNAPVDIERTILYGIRSGHPKSRNVTDMPALVRTGIITEAEARDVVEYVWSLSHQDYDPATAERGHDVYFAKGNCYDCHARDAKGIADYGTPALTGPVWVYGGDRPTLYQSVLNGRHGICPAWIDKLSPLQIRSFALYSVGAGTAPVPRLRGFFAPPTSSSTFQTLESPLDGVLGVRCSDRPGNRWLWSVYRERNPFARGTSGGRRIGQSAPDSAQ